MDWLKLAESICVEPYRHKLTVLEAAPGAYRVRDEHANWPRDDVAVYRYESGRWACEADPRAWAEHPCEHIQACQRHEQEATR